MSAGVFSRVRLDLRQKRQTNSAQDVSPITFVPRLTVVDAGNTVIELTTISFKVTDDEARRIRQMARDEKLTLSEFLRQRASGAAVAAKKPERVRCEFTGAMIFGHLENRSPLTNEAVKEFAADFP